MKQYDVLTKPSILALPFLPVVDGDFLLDKPEVGVCVFGRHLEKSMSVLMWVMYMVLFFRAGVAEYWKLTKERVSNWLKQG